MTTSRIIAGTIAVLSAIVLTLSGVELSRRVGRYHKDNPRPFFYAIRTDREAFEFAGRPVTLEPVLDEAGAGVVTLRYGATAVELQVETAQPHELPGLDRYLDWLHVYFMAENGKNAVGGAVPLEDFRRGVQDGRIPLRCIAVVRSVDRTPAAEGNLGVAAPMDEWGWGEVKRDRWRFTFHELMPDGTIESHTLKMPESGASYYRRRVRAYQRGEEPPRRADDELKELTWQWDLALRTMPRAPAITMENQALLAAGWTLPAASAGAIGLLVGAAFAVAPARRRPEAETVTGARAGRSG